MEESYFIFHNILCKQIDGVAMVSLGLSLANAFLAYHEQSWSDRCSLDYIDHYIIDGMLMI